MHEAMHPQRQAAGRHTASSSPNAQYQRRRIAKTYTSTECSTSPMADRAMRRIGPQAGRCSLYATPYHGAVKQTVAKNLFDTLLGQQLGSFEVKLANGSWDYQVSSNQIPTLQRDGEGIVLTMYDGGGNEASALSASINVIRQAENLGYHFMTIPELLKAQGFQGTVAGTAQPSLEDRLGYWLYWGPHITRAQ